MMLPDTNVLIAYFSRNEPSATLVKNSILSRQLKLTVITVAEFLIKASAREAKVIRELVDQFGILEITREVMEQAVKYRKQVLRKQKRVLLLDCFIAATAKIQRATLVTLDKHDYPLAGLSIKQPEEMT